MAAAARPPVVIGADGLPQNLQAGDAFFVGAYTVATLPTGTGIKAGSLAFATNGRALNTAASLINIAFETAGNGTGVLVSYNGTAWKVTGTNSTVAA